MTQRSALLGGVRAGLRRRSALPVAAVSAVVLVLWTMFAVSWGEIARYVGYEAAFDLIPGAALYMALTGRRALGLRTVVIGWPLGYALELAAFSVTAAAGARGLFLAYPVLAVVLAAIICVVARQRQGASGDGAAPDAVDAGSDPGSGWMWGAGVLLIVMLGYLASQYFVYTPLPWDLHQPVSYYQDYVWQISVAAEALHHWPIQIPNVAGEPLRYHYYAFLHMAAAAQVTGLDPALVNFRMYVVPLLMLPVLQLVLIGRALTGGQSWPGVVGAALVFILGPWSPLPTPPSEFLTHLWQSASYGFGVPLFLAAVAELMAVFAAGAGASGRPARRIGSWVTIAVLLAACGGAKSSILPVVAFAAFLAAVYCWRYARARLAPVIAALGVSGALFVVYRYTLYRGTTGLVSFSPLADVKQLQPLAYWESTVHSRVLRVVLVLGSTVVQLVKLLLPLLAGLIAYVRVRPRGDDLLGVWLGALLVASLVPFLLVTTPGGSEVYFLYYGFTAAGALAGVGLWRLWRRFVPPLHPRPAMVAGAVTLALLAWAFEGPLGARNGQPTPSPFWYRLTGPEVPPDIEDPSIVANQDLTPELYAGLRWIRHHTPAAAILATNNRWQDTAAADARYYYYSAFTQRRILLEGDQGTNEAGQGRFLPLGVALSHPFSGPYGERVALVDGMIHGSRFAMQLAARRYGVDYLVIDLIHLTGADRAAIERVVRPVFANPAVAVYQLAGVAAGQSGSLSRG